MIGLGAAFGAAFLMGVSISVKSNFKYLDRSLDRLDLRTLADYCGMPKGFYAAAFGVSIL